MTRLYVIAVELPDDDPKAYLYLHRRAVRVCRFKGQMQKSGKLYEAPFRILWKLPGTVSVPAGEER